MNLQRFSQKTQKFQIQQLNISNGFFPQKNLCSIFTLYCTVVYLHCTVPQYIYIVLYRSKFLDFCVVYSTAACTVLIYQNQNTKLSYIMLSRFYLQIQFSWFKV